LVSWLTTCFLEDRELQELIQNAFDGMKFQRYLVSEDEFGVCHRVAALLAELELLCNRIRVNKLIGGTWVSEILPNTLRDLITLTLMALTALLLLALPFAKCNFARSILLPAIGTVFLFLGGIVLRNLHIAMKYRMSKNAVEQL